MAAAPQADLLIVATGKGYGGMPAPAPAPVESITLTAASPASGQVNQASAAMTLAWANLAAATTITPSVAPGPGTLSPASIAAGPGSGSASLVLTPLAAAVHQIAITNNRGIANPPAVTYTAVTAPAPPPPPADVSGAVFQLFGPDGAAPFSVGFALRQGDVPAGSGVTLSGASVNGQAVIKSTWPDGSARFAICSGTATLAGGVATIQVGSGVAATGTALTTADLKTTGVTASVGCGAFGTVTWSGTDWDSPFSTWVSGPAMSSWIYRKVVGADATLTAWLEVRLWASGDVEILPWIDNGYMRTAGTSKSATYTFSLGGTTRETLTIDLPYRARTPLVSGTRLSHWLGADPGVTAVQDVDYLQATRLVPTYSASVSPSAAVVTGLPSSYTPLQQGNYTDGMGSTGYHEAIGLLPTWDVLFLTCTSPATVFAGLIRNAYSAGRWDIHYRDEATNRPIRFSANPNFSNNSSGTGDYAAAATGTLARGWDIPHHPSVGYFAYLLTGRYYHLETLQFAAGYNYIFQPSQSTNRNGSAGIFLSQSGACTTRGAAWALRTLTQAAMATPDADPLKAEYIASLEANIAYYHARYVAAANNPQGFVQPYFGADNDGGDGKFNERSWMQDFFTAAAGYALAALPSISTASATKLHQFFYWKAQNIVGRLGGTAPDQYLYRDAAVYDIWCAPADPPGVNWDPTAGATGPWYASWGEIYDEQFGVSNPGTGGDLRGGNFPEATSYWGNLQPAIAYAVEHAAPGAHAAWLRMAGASNFATLQTAFNADPVWSVRPPTLPTALPAWLASMPLNQWTEIPGTALSSVAPSPTPLGNNGPRAKIEAWCGAGLKRRRSIYALGAAGGHVDYAGNEVDAIVLSADTPAWVQLRAPSANSQVINGVGDGDGQPTQLYLDGRPSPTHTYHSTHVIESMNRMVVFSSPGYSGSPGAATPVGWGHKSDQINHSFSFAAGDWDIPSALPDFPSSGDFTSQLCVKHPVTDDVYLDKKYDSSWKRWKAATNIWAVLPATGPEGRSWYGGAAIDPARNRMLICGGLPGGNTPEVRGLDGVQISVTFGGLGASELALAEQYTGVQFDEANDCYWVIYLTKSGGNATGTRVLKVDARTWFVSDPGWNTNDMPIRVNGPQNSMQYVPELRGLIYAPSYTGNLYFIRTA